MQEVWRDDIQPDDVVILQSGKYKLTPTEEHLCEHLCNIWFRLDCKIGCWGLLAFLTLEFDATVNEIDKQ